VALICDTGPLYASIDRADPDHRSCVELLANAREPVVVPGPVVVEVEWLSRRRLGPRPISAFLSDVETGAIVIEDLERDDYVRVRELLETYEDLRLGFVDAAVLAVVERLRESKLATLDRRHFGVLRPRHVDVLELVPA
jgi:hypothetical protein